MVDPVRPGLTFSNRLSDEEREELVSALQDTEERRGVLVGILVSERERMRRSMEREEELLRRLSIRVQKEGEEERQHYFSSY